MTDYNPSICLACTRLDRTTMNPGGTFVPMRCTAFPDGIPVEILRGDDHRKVRGDERDGLIFDPAKTALERSRFNAWQDFRKALAS